MKLLGSLRRRLVVASGLLVLTAFIAVACDDFPSVALQNDLDRPVGITWSHVIDERLLLVNGETTILVGEGDALTFALRYDGETYELEIPWDQYTLTADQLGDSDYRVFLSSVMPDRD